MTTKVRIMDWSAWTPANGAPDVSQIAPQLRRRMSPLARISTVAALECCRKAGISPSEPRVIFASRHGEMGVTVELLRQMAAGESLSPTGFSNSVHHGALGYWSLATANRQAMRAVAAGEASFCYGFLEASGMLGESDATPVLLIAADDQVPSPFEAVAGPRHFPYAAAFLMAPATQAGGRAAGVISFSIGGRIKNSADDEKLSGVPALDFLQWFTGEKKSLESVLSHRTWRWER